MPLVIHTIHGQRSGVDGGAVEREALGHSMIFGSAEAVNIYI